MPACEKEEIPRSDARIFYFRWSRSKGGEAYGQRKYGIVGSAWVLHTFDMDSLVGIVDSSFKLWSMLCITKRKEKRGCGGDEEHMRKDPGGIT